MSYTINALSGKIREMYPEIEENGIEMSLVFNQDSDTYFVNFRKGRKVFATHLQKNEADECMEGIKFNFLGSQIGQWMTHTVSEQHEAATMPAASQRAG